MTIERFIELLAVATVQSCLLIVLVLAIRAPIARWLGARWAYYLWLAPLLGLAALAMSGEWLKLFHGLPQLQVPMLDWFRNAAVPAPNTVLVAWLLGFALAISVFMARSVYFWTLLRGFSRALTFEERTIVRERCAGLARRVEVDFRLLSSAEGPAVAGLLNPVLMLPADFFQRYSARQQTLMLSHELQHLCRRDLLARFAARLYRCIFWFNPLVWVAERFVHLDQELSCDERVLSRENSATRRAYGEAMLLSMHAPLAPDQAGYPGPYEQVRARAAHLPHHHRSLVGNALGVLVLLVVGGGSFIFGTLGAVDSDSDAREARELIAAADAHYGSGEYVEALKALVRSEMLAPAQYTPQTWALRGMALAKLEQWDQSLICFGRAIDGEQRAGRTPDERWFLTRTVLQINVGDLDGAARSLDAAAQHHPDTPFERRLEVFSELAEEHWAPQIEVPVAAQF